MLSGLLMLLVVVPGIAFAAELPSIDLKGAPLQPDAAWVKKIETDQAWRKNPFAQQMERQAQKVYDYTQTPAYQKKMDALIGEVFPEQARARAAARESGERLYLFVSSSVPERVLRRYAMQLDGLPGAMMVLRGFIGGATHIKPTIEFIARVLQRDPDCLGARCRRYRTQVIVDPMLFRRYEVARVPAIVTAGGLVTDGSCSEGNAGVVKVASHEASMGDAPVITHLAALRDGGDVVAERYLQYIGERDNGNQ